MICEITGCSRKHRAKGLCALHYDRKIRGRKIEQSNIHGTEWFDIPSQPNYAASREGWILSKRYDRILEGRIQESGHHSVSLGRNRTGLVHRLVCEAFHGPAPDDKPWALHRNGDPSDNRPENLYWGDNSDNQRDSAIHGTHRNSRKTHCAPAGHEYTVENTITRKSGKRECRKCENERQKRRRT